MAAKTIIDPPPPTSGWETVQVHDMKMDGLDSSEYPDCEYCGQPTIRFVHVIMHAEWPSELGVGCKCVEALTGDKVGPSAREKELRNLANRTATAARRKQAEAEKQAQATADRLERRRIEARDAWARMETEWVYGPWRVSRNGNSYRKTDDGRFVTIFSSDRGFKFVISGHPSYFSEPCQTMLDAKTQAVVHVWRSMYPDMIK